MRSDQGAYYHVFLNTPSEINFFFRKDVDQNREKLERKSMGHGIETRKNNGN